MHSICWRQQNVLHWKPERCLITVTKGRMTPAGQRQTYWHENCHFALFSHHMCYFQVAECNFKLIHLFWLLVEWSFAHSWLKNWVASPCADPKNTYFVFESWGGGKRYFCPLLSIAPPSVDHSMMILKFRLHWPRRQSFRSVGAILFSRDELSQRSLAKPAAVLGPCERGGCRGAGGWAQAPRLISAEAFAPRLKPTGMDLGPSSGTS